MPIWNINTLLHLSLIGYNAFIVDCGYGLVVEHVLAKDEIRVRFPVPAHNENTALWSCIFIITHVHPEGLEPPIQRPKRYVISISPRVRSYDALL